MIPCSEQRHWTEIGEEFKDPFFVGITNIKKRMYKLSSITLNLHFESMCDIRKAENISFYF